MRPGGLCDKGGCSRTEEQRRQQHERFSRSNKHNKRRLCSNKDYLKETTVWTVLLQLQKADPKTDGCVDSTMVVRRVSFTLLHQAVLAPLSLVFHRSNLFNTCHRVKRATGRFLSVSLRSVEFTSEAFRAPTTVRRLEKSWRPCRTSRPRSVSELSRHGRISRS